MIKFTHTFANGDAEKKCPKMEGIYFGLKVLITLAFTFNLKWSQFLYHLLIVMKGDN